MQFEYYLADRLKMMVSQLRESMGQDEFVYWYIWHARKAQQQELAEKMAKHQR